MLGKRANFGPRGLSRVLFEFVLKLQVGVEVAKDKAGHQATPFSNAFRS
jgi:hypothetical protein